MVNKDSGKKQNYTHIETQKTQLIKKSKTTNILQNPVTGGGVETLDSKADWCQLYRNRPLN